MILKTNIPIFEQIYEEYKKLINLGIFKVGDKLPSVRELGIELGINPNTVSRAYDLLIQEGYVKSIEKKGIYVASRDNDNNKRDEIKKYINEIKESGYKKGELIKIINEVYGEKL